ncbi:MAG: fucose isomerase [candidate division KSB1 bacterium]|nr:fucose isomerase [candidate division KSB1 bacterium]MDZ7276243.1 fucose isomerase [candidate division KSB1 bacterium]MDZ7287951.1 fucose isomerase [candidate division KSB1 bacterium]MDZ7300036.1 fucose isomerase [candidate division KSB1 bacterium]MDZ7308426.1 fucose isomerase [candidate division KSB1 bacterium]
MQSYLVPRLRKPPRCKRGEVYLIASGDLRLAANQTCWPAQMAMEQRLVAALQEMGAKVIRAHEYNPALGHGFIWNQRMGMDVLQRVPPEAPLIVAEAVWQYSYHVLAGLRDHRGPILTVANWSGQWPGLVGLLNLNGSLTKMGVAYSTIWSENFTDAFFLKGVQQWLRTGRIRHDLSHVRPLNPDKLPKAEARLGTALARQLQREKAILGVFDEGCMGMYNAIIEDELLNPAGLYKERLSQSALVAAMREVTEAEALQARRWLEQRGMRFITGTNEETELTDAQVHEQLKMYIAAVRLAAEFHCDAIGIQYQQGLQDMAPASDLAEGLLNNVERPPVFRRGTNEELFAGQALPHFNEVDEGSAVDALVTNRVWRAMGFDPATTLHDVRWGAPYHGDGIDDFVWVFMISGAAPASHLVGGYAGATSERQPPMYFRLGGGTLKGVSKPGEIVWSRVYVERGRLYVDLGRGTAVALPAEETARRWQATTPQWPIMHAVLHGVSRDQMMAKHKSNHVQVAYAPNAKAADQALAAKAAMFAEMGLTVRLCGTVKVG